MRSSTFSSRTSLRILGYLFVVSTLFFSLHTHAAEYVPLVGLPGFMDKGSQGLPDYVNAVYLLTIGLGALVGVLRISMAGIKYALTDIVTHKGEAIHEIQGVLLGLAVLLIPFTVLNTINPNLTNLDVLSGVQKIKTMKVDTGTVTNSSIGTQDMTSSERTELRASCAASLNKTSSGKECCSALEYSGKFSCPREATGYQDTELQAVRTAVQQNAASSTETTFPIKWGTDQEWDNLRAICKANMPGGFVIKDPSRNVYVCKK